MASASGALATTISIVSVMNRIQLNITSDTAQVDDIEHFINLFNQKIEQYGIRFAEDEED